MVLGRGDRGAEPQRASQGCLDSLTPSPWTWVIVFVILHSKMQFLCSEISGQNALLLGMGLFCITTLGSLAIPHSGTHQKVEREETGSSWNSQMPSSSLCVTPGTPGTDHEAAWGIRPTWPDLSRRWSRTTGRWDSQGAGLSQGRPWFQSWFCCFPSTWAWVTYWNILWLSFFVCKLGTITPLIELSWELQLIM